MNNSAHISLETLADIEEGRLPAADREAAMVHVATCPSCDERLRLLRQLIFRMRSDTMVDPPLHVLMSAVEIFSSPVQSLLPRLIATLVFDSRSTTPAFGMRSLHSNSRQLLYSAQETDLDLRITVQNQECFLSGQVIREHCEGGVIEISGETGSVEASLNDLCEFALPAIPVGHYSLKIRLPDVEIEIPELELKD